MSAIKRLAVACAGVLTALGCTLPSANAAPFDTITINDESMKNIVGLAADPDHQVFWVSNDSSSNSLYAIDPSGNKVGEIAFDGAVKDIEGLAYSEGRLYVADIGDAGGARDIVDIYSPHSLQYGMHSSADHWMLQFPDGAHQAKAFAVSPRGNFYVITFGAPGGVYLGENYNHQPGNIDLIRVGDAPNWVTDAAFVSGQDAAMRTYNSVLMVNMFEFKVWASQPSADEPFGESITPNFAKDALYTASKESQKLTELAIPSAIDNNLPQAAQNPPGQPNVEPSAQPSEKPAEPAQANTPSSDMITPDAQAQTGKGLSRSTIFVIVAVALSISAALMAFFVPGLASKPTKRQSASRRSESKR